MTGDEKIPFYSQFENAIWPPQRSSLMTNLLSTLEEEVKDDHDKTFLPPPTPQNSVESNLSIVPKCESPFPLFFHIFILQLTRQLQTKQRSSKT